MPAQECCSKSSRVAVAPQGHVFFGRIRRVPRWGNRYAGGVIIAAALLIAGAGTAFSGGTAHDIKPSPKRGYCGSGALAQPVGASWYYTWFITPTPNAAAEFVPMIKRGEDANGWYYDRINELKKTHHITTLLGFNEPERKG